MPEEKRLRISQETRFLYAPLAHRFGLAAMKAELEDLAFKFLEPDEYKTLAKLIVQKRKERESLIEEMATPLRQRLAEAGIKVYEASGRPKHSGRSSRRWQKRDKPYEEIYDLLAIC